MNKLLLTIGLGVALVAPAAAEGQDLIAARALCGDTCGTFSATGNGLIVVQGLGVTWGDDISGMVAVRDLSDNGRRDFSVQGATRSSVVNGEYRYWGRDLRFAASTRFRVAVRGAQSVSAVARGSVHVDGRGRYHLNGGASRSWPRGGTYQLRK